MTTATKADLLARVAELEAQLAASTQPDPRTAGMTRLVGLLKATKEITSNRPGAKRSACAILVNEARERTPDGREFGVDLPVDAIIATDNGSPLASQLLELAEADWARVAVTGFWVPFGELTRNARGYAVCERRQLRVTAIELLNRGDYQRQTEAPAPFSAEPTSEALPF